MQSKHTSYDDWDQEIESPYSPRQKGIGTLRSGRSVRSYAEPREGASDVWSAIRSLPGVSRWSVLNNTVFMLSSFPIGLAAFMFAVIGGSTGLTLSVALIGLPILVWTIGSLLRCATYERQRLNAFLGLGLSQPRYTDDEGSNVVKHLWAVVRTPQVWRDVMYMMLLLPIGLLQLVLVLLPLELFFPSFSYLAFGAMLSPDIFGFDVSSTTMAMSGLVLGVLSLIPTALLITLVTKAHARFAVRMLGPR